MTSNSTTDTSALREKIARVIDPKAWEARDVEPSIPKHKNRHPEALDWERYRELGCQPSLAKADAILLLTSSERDALAERVEERDFLLAILMATFGGPHGWFETRRLWHSAVQDNYENAYVEQTVADEWRRRASDAETRAREAEAKVETLTRERDGLKLDLIDAGFLDERARADRAEFLLALMAAMYDYETSHLVQAAFDSDGERADANAELQAAQATIKALREGLEKARNGILDMETAGLVGRTHDVWERGHRSGLSAARKILDEQIALLQPTERGDG